MLTINFNKDCPAGFYASKYPINDEIEWQLKNSIASGSFQLSKFEVYEEDILVHAYNIYPDREFLKKCFLLEHKILNIHSTDIQDFDLITTCFDKIGTGEELLTTQVKT